MTQHELQERTKSLALRVIKVVNALPKNPATRVITGQVLRCSTSVGANYRAACRARSKREFVSKISIVLEEVDETAYWLELIALSEFVAPKSIEPLLREARELTAIFAATRITATRKSNLKS